MLEHQKARDFFPRGLSQPPGSFRFSADALLLAAFAARLAGELAAGPVDRLSAGKATGEGYGQAAGLPPIDSGGRALLDLGCGCGVVGLGFMLLRPEYTALGLDLQPELILAARQNAALLGLEAGYRAREVDLRQLHSARQLADAVNLPPSRRQNELNAAKCNSFEHFQPGSFRLVTANPPYRKPGSGRLPVSPARRLALFGDAETLDAFVRVASLSLAPGGLFCLIFSLSREKELHKILLKHELAPAHRLEISGKEGQPPEWLLMSAVRLKDAGAGSAVTWPDVSDFPERLCLRRSQTNRSDHTGNTDGLSRIDELTPEALRFCPFLACNARPSYR
ncbi:MAG: methyltransferase [Deltaproteobacteria bacterium]|jgi:tRNA1(Val) A37 N6-methylase TrmN6|nr:methyltransferase [Deltaproteobacteria bacterium]